MTNPLAQMLASLAGVPTPQRAEKITEIFGNVIPFVGTAGLQFEEMTHRQIVVSTPNERKVQNHIQGVHAVVMALLAETSTGILVGLNLRGDCIPVIKTLKVDYLERAQGALRAVATLSEAQSTLKLRQLSLSYCTSGANLPRVPSSRATIRRRFQPLPEAG